MYDYYDTEELIVADKPKRRRRNPVGKKEAIGTGTVALLALVGFLAWYKTTKHKWPWEGITTTSRRLGRPSMAQLARFAGRARQNQMPMGNQTPGSLTRTTAVPNAGSDSDVYLISTY